MELGITISPRQRQKLIQKFDSKQAKERAVAALRRLGLAGMLTQLVYDKVASVPQSGQYQLTWRSTDVTSPVIDFGAVTVTMSDTGELQDVTNSIVQAKRVSQVRVLDNTAALKALKKVGVDAGAMDVRVQAAIPSLGLTGKGYLMPTTLYEGNSIQTGPYASWSGNISMVK